MLNKPNVLMPVLWWMIVFINPLVFIYGPFSFAGLAFCIYLLWRMGSFPESKSLARPRWLLPLFVVVLLINVVILSASLFLSDSLIIDIPRNTYAAMQAFLAGKNPYVSKAQLWVEHFSSSIRGISFEGDQVLMFGIPYYQGFPYFPMMMLSYIPFHLLVDGYTGMRVAHIFFLLLDVIAFILVVQRCVAPAQRITANLLALSLLFGTFRYQIEAVTLGVTDILLSVYLLYAFVGFCYQRYWLVGLFLGLAQATKLLPAPFVFLVFTWLILADKQWRAFFTMALVYGLSSLLILLPFIVWDWQGFLSATVLYYLTHHKGGDMTSFMFFLPSSIKTVFLYLGPFLSLLSIPLFCRRYTNALVAGLAASFVTYAVFMMFSEMTHANYLWSVLPLGVLALALMLVGAQYKKLSCIAFKVRS